MDKEMEAKVLLVDDEQDFLETLSSRLELRGLKVSAVTSGEQAVSEAKEDEYDAIVVDLSMPGIDGLETLKRIKAISPDAEIIMLTGHASVESGINGIKYGAFDYLMKPMELDPLFEKLNAAYERKRTQQEKIEMAQIKRDMSRPG